MATYAIMGAFTFTGVTALTKRDAIYTKKELTLKRVSLR